MSEIFVDSSFLADAAVRISGIAPGVDEFRERVTGHAHAAAGTRAAQGMADLADHWHAVLGGFSEASGSLAGALRVAAADYRGADQSVVSAVAGQPAGGVG
jgi:hypothetical protein